jgi:hypothetical protein
MTWEKLLGVEAPGVTKPGLVMVRVPALAALVTLTVMNL